MEGIEVKTIQYVEISQSVCIPKELYPNQDTWRGYVDYIFDYSRENNMDVKFYLYKGIGGSEIECYITPDSDKKDFLKRVFASMYGMSKKIHSDNLHITIEVKESIKKFYNKLESDKKDRVVNFSKEGLRMDSLPKIEYVPGGKKRFRKLMKTSNKKWLYPYILLTAQIGQEYEREYLGTSYEDIIGVASVKTEIYDFDEAINVLVECFKYGKYFRRKDVSRNLFYDIIDEMICWEKFSPSRFVSSFA